MPLRVAYQGEHGAYSEQAVLTLFRQHTDVIPVPRVTFSAVFEVCSTPLHPSLFSHHLSTARCPLTPPPVLPVPV